MLDHRAASHKRSVPEKSTFVNANLAPLHTGFAIQKEIQNKLNKRMLPVIFNILVFMTLFITSAKQLVRASGVLPTCCALPLLLAVFLMIGANPCAAQGFNLSGTVRDPKGKPLANVTVELSTRSYGRRTTGTDENGRYVLGGLAPGNYQVSFELAGYATIVRVIPVKFDKDTKDDDKDNDKDKDGDVILVPQKRGSK